MNHILSRCGGKKREYKRINNVSDCITPYRARQISYRYRNVADHRQA